MMTWIRGTFISGGTSLVIVDSPEHSRLSWPSRGYRVWNILVSGVVAIRILNPKTRQSVGIIVLIVEAVPSAFRERYRNDLPINLLVLNQRMGWGGIFPTRIIIRS